MEIKGKYSRNYFMPPEADHIPAVLVVEVAVVGGVGLHQRRSGRLDFCRVHSTPGGPLDLLKGIEGGVERRVDFSEHAADTVIEDHLRSDCCHEFTPSFKN